MKKNEKYFLGLLLFVIVISIFFDLIPFRIMVWDEPAQIYVGDNIKLVGVCLQDCKDALTAAGINWRDRSSYIGGIYTTSCISGTDGAKQLSETVLGSPAMSDTVTAMSAGSCAVKFIVYAPNLVWEESSSIFILQAPTTTTTLPSVDCTTCNSQADYDRIYSLYQSGRCDYLAHVIPCVEKLSTTTTTTTQPIGECIVPVDCEGRAHPYVPGYWNCVQQTCLWIPYPTTTTTTYPTTTTTQTPQFSCEDYGYSTSCISSDVISCNPIVIEGLNCYQKQIIITTTTTTTTTILLPPPTPPILPSPLEWLSQKIASFISWLKSLFGLQILQQKTNYLVGSAASFDINLALSAIDSDYSDGTYQKRYGLWFVTNDNGDIIDVGQWDEVTTAYMKTVEITAPAVGDYYFVALVNQYGYTFADMDWVITEPITIKQESVAFATYEIWSPPAPTLPNPIAWITNIISNFINWLIGLWR